MNKLLFLPFLFCFCHQPDTTRTIAAAQLKDQAPRRVNAADTKVIHVLVALCDNTYQGIVPVPAKIGNGQDAATNLYWGCGFGVRTFFARQKNWQLQQDNKYPAGSLILERLVFKYKGKEVYLVADAYDGKEIKNCTINFFKCCSGNFTDSVQLNSRTLYCGGAADIIAYVGHDGLMDFKISESFQAIDTQKREAMVFACISKHYFNNHLKNTGATPVVWTTGLCSPEAYSLAAALQSRIENEPVQNAALRAAEAYSKYQKCSLKAAQRLLVFN